MGRLESLKLKHLRALCGPIFAKFSYNALGWRTTAAVYDGNGDGQLTDETIEYCGYDERWQRLRQRSITS